MRCSAFIDLVIYYCKLQCYFFYDSLEFCGYYCGNSITVFGFAAAATIKHMEMYTVVPIGTAVLAAAVVPSLTPNAFITGINAAAIKAMTAYLGFNTVSTCPAEQRSEAVQAALRSRGHCVRDA